MPSTIPHFHHDEIEDQGFTIIRNFLTPQEIELYKKTARSIVEIARKGDWNDVRTRGKQFPPWPKNFSPDIWGVTGLLNPGLGDLSVTLQDAYASDKILAVASDILQTDKDHLCMELFNMLINPLTDFGLDWHRDYIKPEVTVQEEREKLLENPFSGTQFNLALTPDDCLIVIPKSHNRVRTEDERLKTSGEDRQQFIEGQISVHLDPGDVVFYNNNILHRAQYFSANERLTLHGSYGHIDFGKFRAMGVLQHGVGEWIDKFQPSNANMELLYNKLVDLNQEFKSKSIVYALDG